jgi:soluble lytic murein transglycosylase
MTDKEKHAAAYNAIKWRLPNWAILALSKANNKNDLTLRFPLTYAQHILQEAQKHKLDPAWILAITRQESAFVPHAKSYKGALGLMQLIPSTAQMVARKKRILLADHTELLNPHTNIQLGSGYLKMMLDKHCNNPILATAAYNAGPGRIPKWLPTFDMAADLWIETIPFKETREYVKNVITYTAIYQELLGKKPTLGRYMVYIPRNKN